MKDNYIQCEKCHTRFYKKGKEKNCPNCREYQPIETKTIICQDCGKEITVDGIIKKQIRCTECQKKKQLEWQRNSMKKNRNKEM